MIVQYYRVSHQSLLIGDERERTCKMIAAAVSSLAERKGIQLRLANDIWKCGKRTDRQTPAEKIPQKMTFVRKGTRLS